ncbi:MAG: ATP-grasp domain-containing protein [Gemmatimonadaceae bacterium]
MPPTPRTAGRPRVLLLDEGFMSGALAAVGLRDAGCEVAVLAACGGRARCRTRSLAWTMGPAPGDPALPAAVERAAVEWRAEHLLPCTEPLQALAWGADAPWAAHVFPRVAGWQREALAGKRALAALARARGIPVPRDESGPSAADPACSDDAARAAAARLGLPIVVKGERGRGGSATFIASSVADATRAARAMVAAGETPFFQEYVHGATHLVGGVFQAGRPLRLYAGEKVEQHPPRVGPASRMRSVAPPRLLDVALATFAALEWTGMASADLVARADGEFLLLEVNPRPWGSIAGAAAAGVDLFGPAAELLRGRTPSADLRYAVGVETRVLPLYLLARGTWSPRRVPSTLRALAADLAGAQGKPWRSPAQAAHLLHRLVRVGRNWRRAAPP